MEEQYRLHIDEAKKMFKKGLVYKYVKPDTFTFKITKIQDNIVFGLIIEDESWEDDIGKVVKICDLDAIYSDDFKPLKHMNTTMWRLLNGQSNN